MSELKVGDEVFYLPPRRLGENADEEIARSVFTRIAKIRSRDIVCEDGSRWTIDGQAWGWALDLHRPRLIRGSDLSRTQVEQARRRVVARKRLVRFAEAVRTIEDAAALEAYVAAIETVSRALRAQIAQAQGLRPEEVA